MPKKSVCGKTPVVMTNLLIGSEVGELGFQLVL